jgi:hypothetical protein
MAAKAGGCPASAVASKFRIEARIMREVYRYSGSVGMIGGW